MKTIPGSVAPEIVLRCFGSGTMVPAGQMLTALFGNISGHVLFSAAFEWIPSLRAP